MYRDIVVKRFVLCRSSTRLPICAFPIANRQASVWPVKSMKSGKKKKKEDKGDIVDMADAIEDLPAGVFEIGRASYFDK